jgi:hypothetical protein
LLAHRSTQTTGVGGDAGRAAIAAYSSGVRYSQATVRTYRVVVLSPSLDTSSLIFEAGMPTLIHALVAELAVEAFDEGRFASTV